MRVEAWLASIGKQLVRLRAQLFLQRLAQRHSAAGKSHRPDRDQSRRHPARPRASQRLAHPGPLQYTVIKKLIRKLFGQDSADSTDERIGRRCIGIDRRRRRDDTKAAARKTARKKPAAPAHPVKRDPNVPVILSSDIHGIDPDADLEERDPRDRRPAASRAPRVHRRRRGARPAARRRAERFRRRHRRHARTGAEAVPPRAHHRPAVSDRACAVRPGHHRDVDVPRARRHSRRRAARRAAAAPEARRAGRAHACGRCERPRAARQRLGRAARRRHAPRLHDQRDVLRSGDANRAGLSRRHGRYARAPVAHDRRPGHALSRRPGADAARRAFRGEARLRDRRARRARRSRNSPT